MAIALGGTGSSALADGVSTRATASVTIPADAVVVAAIKWEDASRTPTMSGGGVGTWTYLTTVASGGGSNGSLIRVAYGVSTGATGALTASYGSNTPWCELGVLWFTGCDTSDPFDASSSATGSASTATAPAITNANADAVYILGCVTYAGANFSAWTFGGVGGTEDFDGDTLGLGHLIVSSAASRSGAVTVSGAPDNATTMLVLNAAASATALSGTSPSSTWGQAGTLAASGSAALSGTRASSTWGEAGTLSGSGAVALSGTSPGSSWGQAGTLAAVSAALSGTSPASTWGAAGTLAVQGGAQALSGTSPGSSWGAAGTLAAVSVALSGVSPGSTWGQAGTLAAVSAALSGTSPAATWAGAGTLAGVGSAALTFTAPFSTWGAAGTLGEGVSDPSPGGGGTTAGVGLALTTARGGTTTAARGVTSTSSTTRRTETA